MKYFVVIVAVPYNHLLAKLQSCGISGSLLLWVRKNFVLGRQQRVMIAGTGSDWASVLSGVPQGSVLGPAGVLFVCCINDMLNTASLLFIYADDTKVTKKVGSIQNCTILQSANRSKPDSYTWSDIWQLKFNSTKCKIMHIGHTNIRAKYSSTASFPCSVMESTSEENDLGVWIDDKLKFTSHVGHVVAKSNQILGLIKRTFVYKLLVLFRNLLH